VKTGAIHQSFRKWKSTESFVQVYISFIFVLERCDKLSAQFVTLSPAFPKAVMTNVLLDMSLVYKQDGVLLIRTQ
jgi:hypothetical protein